MADNFDLKIGIEGEIPQYYAEGSHEAIIPRRAAIEAFLDTLTKADLMERFDPALGADCWFTSKDLHHLKYVAAKQREPRSRRSF